VHESCHNYCPGSSRTRFRRLRSNIFLHFIPMPPPPPDCLETSRRPFPEPLSSRRRVFQIVGGLLLLIGRFVPLGLVLLAPVIVNIDLVHILLDPSGLPMAIVISILLSFSSGDIATRLENSESLIQPWLRKPTNRQFSCRARRRRQFSAASHCG